MQRVSREPLVVKDSAYLPRSQSIARAAPGAA